MCTNYGVCKPKVPVLRYFYLAVDKEVPPPEEKEAIYSEAEDGQPKPIPVAEFARYFKNKSENGAIVLREEFKVIQSNSY